MKRIAYAVLLTLAALGAAACAGQGETIPPTTPGPLSPAAAATTPSELPTPTPFSAPSDGPLPIPLPSTSPVEPEATPGPTVPPGTTPFPTPGPTITPGSTRVIGTLVRPDGSPAAQVCVVLEKGICPIATDDQGMWFTDIPAGPLNWNFIYKVNGQEAGRQFLMGSSGGELRLGVYTLTG